MFSQSPQNRPLGAFGSSLGRRGPQTGVPECPRDAQRAPKPPIWSSIFALFLYFLALRSPMGSRALPRRPPEPKSQQKWVPSLQKLLSKPPAVLKNTENWTTRAQRNAKPTGRANIPARTCREPAADSPETLTSKLDTAAASGGAAVNRRRRLQ